MADSLAESHSHLNCTVHTAGVAAEFATECKVRKYTDLSRSLFFVPIAVETLGPLCASGAEFISELGRRVASNSGDPRESSFVVQANLNYDSAGQCCSCNGYSEVGLRLTLGQVILTFLAVTLKVVSALVSHH